MVSPNVRDGLAARNVIGDQAEGFVTLE